MHSPSLHQHRRPLLVDYHSLGRRGSPTTDDSAGAPYSPRLLRSARIHPGLTELRTLYDVRPSLQGHTGVGIR